MDRNRLIDEIATMTMRKQDVTEAYDEAVGEAYGLSASERRCLSALYEGPQPAGAIAAATGLTPAAVTALVDRLEARGFVRRTRSLEDRRKVLVEWEQPSRDLADRYYGPIARDGHAFLGTFSSDELEVIHRFAEGVLGLQERHLRELSDRPAKARPR